MNSEKESKRKMSNWKKQVIRGSHALYIVGASLIVVAVSALLKFLFPPLFPLLYPTYIIALIIAGLSLIFCGTSYYAGGVQFSASTGKIAGILSMGLGTGYFLMGVFLLPQLFDILMVGIALTIIKIFLFFYPIITMYYFFEIKYGKYGGAGALLILFFSTSHHFFVFSPEFYKTLPGSIMTIIAGLGFILQGYSMKKSTKPLTISFPRKRKWIHISTFKES